jgi:outer membrane immunogenic protein
LGCNYQFDPHWVVGVEGDWSSARLNATGAAPNLFANGGPVGSGGVTWSSNTQWLASLRARAGYLVMPNTLLFVTGGAAWTRTDYAALDQFRGGCPNCNGASFSSTRTGFAVGGGAEYALTTHWLLRGEYLYYRFRGESMVSPTSANVVFNWSDLQVHEARAAISYRF